MPYVTRSSSGEITSLHRDAVAGAEALPANHPEVTAFLDRDSRDQAFASMDAELIRVLEDLVDVLIARNVICVTDLPIEAQHKLFARRSFRDRFRHNVLDLFGDHAPGRAETAPPARKSPAPAGAEAPLANRLRLL